MSVEVSTWSLSLSLPPYLEADAAPGQDSDGARHGEAKLDKVASIVITSNEAE